MIRIGYDMRKDQLVLEYLGVNVDKLPSASRQFEVFRCKIEETISARIKYVVY